MLKLNKINATFIGHAITIGILLAGYSLFYMYRNKTKLKEKQQKLVLNAFNGLTIAAGIICGYRLLRVHHTNIMDTTFYVWLGVLFLGFHLPASINGFIKLKHTKPKYILLIIQAFFWLCLLILSFMFRLTDHSSEKKLEQKYGVIMHNDQHVLTRLPQKISTPSEGYDRGICDCCKNQKKYLDAHIITNNKRYSWCQICLCLRAFPYINKPINDVFLYKSDNRWTIVSTDKELFNIVKNEATYTEKYQDQKIEDAFIPRGYTITSDRLAKFTWQADITQLIAKVKKEENKIPASEESKYPDEATWPQITVIEKNNKNILLRPAQSIGKKSNAKCEYCHSEDALQLNKLLYNRNEYEFCTRCWAHNDFKFAENKNSAEMEPEERKFWYKDNQNRWAITFRYPKDPKNDEHVSKGQLKVWNLIPNIYSTEKYVDAVLPDNPIKGPNYYSSVLLWYDINWQDNIEELRQKGRELMQNQ